MAHADLGDRASVSRSDSLLRPFLFPGMLALGMAVLHLLGLFGLLGPIEWWSNTPRSLSHWPGIFLFHFRHASWEHWFANAGALVALSGLAGMLVPRAARRAWVWIFLLSGILLWIWGRPGGHIGASALTYGWFHFLLGMGLWRRDRAAIAGMLAALFLFGGMFWVFFAPQGVSWEGDVAGAVAGHWAAWKWRKLDPLPPPLFQDEEDPAADELSLYATRRPADPWH